MTTDENIFDEASGWIARQNGGDMDWPAFTAWLEADPRHRAAYDDMALIEAAIDTHRENLRLDPGLVVELPANDDSPVRFRRWAGLGGGAIAAALAIGFLVQPYGRPLPIQDYRATVDAREIALADGTKVTLAPASDLRVQGSTLTLNGAAYFDVPHREGRTLDIHAGGFSIADIGTRFSVENEYQHVRIAVAEGSLTVRAARLAKPISLSAGHGFDANLRDGAIALASVAPEKVAGWRSGQLEFDQMPLALVARDVARYSGQTIQVDPAIADRPFSGVIAIDQGGSPGRTLAQILSLDAVPVAGGVRLQPRRH